MKEKKLTKKDYFNKLKGLVTDPELLAFIDNELALLEKKRTSTTKNANQIANEGLKETILNFLQTNADKKFTITEIWKAMPNSETLSNQKVSALVSQLKKEQKVERTEEKKVAYFYVI